MSSLEDKALEFISDKQLNQDFRTWLKKYYGEGWAKEFDDFYIYNG